MILLECQAGDCPDLQLSEKMSCPFVFGEAETSAENVVSFYPRPPTCSFCFGTSLGQTEVASDISDTVNV